ncbi:MAG: hypothetical protein AAGM67_15225, partial [Bacteroidota bacterium]
MPESRCYSGISAKAVPSDALSFFGNFWLLLWLEGFGGIRNQFFQLSQFFLAEMAPFSDRDIKLDIHDPDPLEFCYAVFK